MIIVSARIETEPGTVEAMTDAISTMMQASEAEEGCYAYVFSSEIGRPEIMRVFERWEDEDALKAHFKTPHMATFQAALAKHRPKAWI